MTDLDMSIVMPDLVVLPGERWRIAPEAPRNAVSTEGRAVRIGQLLHQMSRHGTMMLRYLKPHLVSTLGKCPRLIVEQRDGNEYYTRVDLGRQVLGAFVRPGRRGELATRRNLVLFDCRLENLVWSDDRTEETLEGFLAGAAKCHETPDLDTAALYLGVSRSVLCKALTRERKRLGITSKPGPRQPADVAAALVAAR